MKLLVGLGNPEAKYQKTRHNVGVMIIDKLKGELKREFVLKKSSVFMNSSGIFIKKLISDYSLKDLDNLYVIHDDLDIKLGEYKIQFGKGPKDHNGIISIENELKTKDFWRIRVGIENRESQNKIKGELYTLENFLPQELIIINSVVAKIQKKLLNI